MENRLHNEKDDTKKLIDNIVNCQKVLRGDISKSVMRIVKAVTMVEENVNTRTTFAICMTVLSNLLLNNQIIIKREIKNDNEEKDDV